MTHASRRLGFLFGALLAATGCDFSSRSNDMTVTDAWRNQRAAGQREAPTSAPAGTGTAATAAARAEGPRPAAIAHVNGEPIDRNKLVDTLIRGYGLGVLQQEMALVVVRQAAAAAGIQVNNGDIDHEYDLTIQAAHLDGTGPATLTPIRRAELIELWLKRTGVSPVELRTAMTRQAMLRKMAEGHVTVSESAMREEFERQFGEKVEVRHIQLSSLREYDRLRARLAAGEDFGAMAALFSQNQATSRDGGLLPPFSRNDTRFSATLRDAAFRLKPGETSNPVRYDNELHVLKLERRLVPTTQRYEDVRGALEEGVRARLVAEEMDRLSIELLNKAQLSISDPVLREAYDREHAAGRIPGPALGR